MSAGVKTRDAKGKAHARAKRRTRITLSPPLWSTLGACQAREWLAARGLELARSSFLEIALDVVDRPASTTYTTDTDTRFHLNIYPEEWGIFFCHGGRASWIRMTDELFVHGRDEHKLRDELPTLAHIGDLVRTLESRFGIAFRRDFALVHSNLTGARTAVREWLAAM
jgi:hypothetical protein